MLESNVHFPTDISLLWDVARKSLDLIGYLIEGQAGNGWRKYRNWQKRVKNRFQVANRIMTRGGRNHQTRFARAVLAYLQLTGQLRTKIRDSKAALWAIAEGCERREDCFDLLEYFEVMLYKHVALVRRRVIFKDSIPQAEKVFSVFEPWVRWVNKGKSGGRIELGLPITIATDQFGFILAHRVMETENDVDMAVPVAEAVLSMGKVDSISYDRGYWSPDNFRKLAHRVRLLVMPKKGRRDKQEAEREGNREFKQLRRAHAAVESDINALEHHGLNRCPDRGLIRFCRYTALGILALNLHRLGNILIERERGPTRRSRAAA